MGNDIQTLNLSTEEKHRFIAHEQTIRDTFRAAFYEVGTSLVAIRDERLYREVSDTFEDYCQTRWDMSRQRASQLIGAAKVLQNLSTIVDKNTDDEGLLPINEAQARPLAGLKPDLQIAAWRIATQNGKPTTETIQLAADKVKPYRAPRTTPHGVDDTTAPTVTPEPTLTAEDDAVDDYVADVEEIQLDAPPSNENKGVAHQPQSVSEHPAKPIGDLPPASYPVQWNTQTPGVPMLQRPPEPPCAPVIKKPGEGPFTFTTIGEFIYDVVDARMMVQFRFYGAFTMLTSVLKAMNTPKTAPAPMAETKPILAVVGQRAGLAIDETDALLKTYGEKHLRAALNFILETEFTPPNAAEFIEMLLHLVKPAEKVKPTKKAAKVTTPAEEMNPMKNALVEAFGWSWKDMPKSAIGEVQAAAKELCELNVNPLFLKFGYAYCKKNFDTFRPGALVKWYPDWKKTVPAHAGKTLVVQPDYVSTIPRQPWKWDDVPKPEDPEEAAALMEQIMQDMINDNKNRHGIQH